jgi:hypothetical protein
MTDQTGTSRYVSHPFVSKIATCIPPSVLTELSDNSDLRVWVLKVIQLTCFQFV